MNTKIWTIDGITGAFPEDLSGNNCHFLVEEINEAIFEYEEGL